MLKAGSRLQPGAGRYFGAPRHDTPSPSTASFEHTSGLQAAVICHDGRRDAHAALNPGIAPDDGSVDRAPVFDGAVSGPMTVGPNILVLAPMEHPAPDND